MELIELPYGVYETKVRRTTKLAQATSPDGEGWDGVIKQKIYELAPTLSPTGEGSCKAIANYGLRPTVNGEKPILEVHILDFDKDIYGEQIQVEFIKKIRNEKKFNSLDELKEQIKKDLEII